MANPLKILTDLQLSGSTGRASVVEGAISGSGNLQAGGTLTVGGASTLQSVTASAVTSSGVSSFATLNVGAGGLTVDGNLTVNGTTTTINSTILTVDDINVVLAQGNTSDATADGGGISLSGSTVKTFNWVNSNGGKWTSSENLDLASGKTFKIATVDVVKQTTFSQGIDNGAYTVNVTGSQLVSGSSAAYIGIGAGSVAGIGSIGDVVLVKGSATTVFGGNTGLRLEASGSGGGGVTIGAYGNNETITLTGSEGQVTLSELITVVQAGSGISSVNYYKIRTVVSGTKTSGNTTVTFLLSGSNNDNQMGNQPTGSHVQMSGSDGDSLMQKMGGLSFDISARSGDSNTWTNDLVSVTTTASLGNGTDGFYWPKIVIDAPGIADNKQVRLIAINENDSII